MVYSSVFSIRLYSKHLFLTQAAQKLLNIAKEGNKNSFLVGILYGKQLKNVFSQAMR